MIADGTITDAEKAEIKGLIDFRNVIAHQIHELFADISSERIAHEMVTHGSGRPKSYDHAAVGRLQHFHKLLDGRAEHYVATISFNSLLFRSAEKTFLAEVKRLRRKISGLIETRRTKIETLNAELSLRGTGLEGEAHPQHPLNRYDDGRLTKRGVEICYRLFDRGKSTIAVAHLTGLSLVAARHRRHTWSRIGGVDRKKVNINTIPRRKFYASRNDD